MLVVDDEGKGQEKVCADVPRAEKGGLECLDCGTEAETTTSSTRMTKRICRRGEDGIDPSQGGLKTSQMRAMNELEIAGRGRSGYSSTLVDLMVLALKQRKVSLFWSQNWGNKSEDTCHIMKLVSR